MHHNSKDIRYMRKKIVVLLVLLLFSGCKNNSLFQFKNIKINGETIEIPVNVKEFAKKEGLVIEKNDKIAEHSSITLELENYSIIIENNTDKKIAIEDATIVGFTQNIDNVSEEYIITFPEKLYVGQNIDPDNVIKMLTSTGDIKGDAGYIINDDESEYKVIGGKRIINLSSDLKTESEKVIYPIEITIKNNVITSIQMIFVDQ